VSHQFNQRDSNIPEHGDGRVGWSLEFNEHERLDLGLLIATAMQNSIAQAPVLRFFQSAW
jgi:hypothetical protein